MRETIVETVIVAEAIIEAGAIETVIERIVTSELVSENIGPAGGRGERGSPGRDGRDGEAVVVSSIIFDGGHF